MYLAVRSERARLPVLICPQAARPRGRRWSILGLARPVRHYRGVAGRLGQADRVDRLGQRADLVDLDQDRVGDAVLDALGKPRLVGHEQIVPDQLDAMRRACRSALPAGHIVLGHAVLDRGDRIGVAQLREIVGHLLGDRVRPSPSIA